jgi:hypothetical protein
MYFGIDMEIIYNETYSVFDTMERDIKKNLFINPIVNDSYKMTICLLSLLETSNDKDIVAHDLLDNAKATSTNVRDAQIVADKCRKISRSASTSFFSSLYDLKYLIDWNKKTILCANSWQNYRCYYCLEFECQRHKTPQSDFYSDSDPYFYCKECHSDEEDGERNLCSSCRSNKFDACNVPESISLSITEFIKSRKIELNWCRRFPFAEVLHSVKDEEPLTPLMRVLQCHDMARLIGSFL